MTPGQIAQLQDLSKCYMPRSAKAFVQIWLDPYFTPAPEKERMDKTSKMQLRMLTHQYRHQIAAVKRNQAR
jgi:hypothetical protein